jgi:hypothetical protein
MFRVGVLFTAALALTGAGSALAQSVTYRCVDSSGRSSYTNVKAESGTQKARDETRRKILQEELDSAERRLGEARQKLGSQQSSRNAAENIKPYQEEVERQEQNIASLKRELGNLR